MRCFLGIPLEASTIDALVAARETIRKADISWFDEKWVTSENLHITVKFLGDIDEASVPGLMDSISAVAGRSRPVRLPLTKVAAVPSTHRARMVWAAFDDVDGAASDFAAAADEVGVEYGVEPEERDYKAHATLCRARRPRRIDPVSLERANEQFSGRALMSEGLVRLYSSVLTPRGPLYEVLGSWPIGESPDSSNA